MDARGIPKEVAKDAALTWFKKFTPKGSPKKAKPQTSGGLKMVRGETESSSQNHI